MNYKKQYSLAIYQTKNNVNTDSYTFNIRKMWNYKSY